MVQAVGPTMARNSHHREFRHLNINPNHASTTQVRPHVHSFTAIQTLTHNYRTSYRTTSQTPPYSMNLLWGPPHAHLLRDLPLSFINPLGTFVLILFTLMQVERGFGYIISIRILVVSAATQMENKNAQFH